MTFNPNNITRVIQRTRSMFTNPRKEWVKIAENEESKKDLFLNYALPLIGLCSLFVFVGVFINYGSVTRALLQMLIVFLSLSGGLYLSAHIVSSMASNFDANININRNFMLVIYATSVFCIFHTAANVFAEFSFFRQLLFLSKLYFVRLLWLGATPLLDISESKKLGFTLISGLIIITIPFIIERMLSIFIDIPSISI